MARHIVECPDHRGVARALNHLRGLAANEAAFADVRVHHSREFAEATGSAQDCELVGERLGWGARPLCTASPASVCVRSARS